MFRPSSVVYKGRTIIRDPRKKKIIRSALVTQERSSNEVVQHQQHSNETKPILPFEPSTQNQQSLGLGSYGIAGAGVALGVTLVGAILGGIGM
jgi:hypothetical protein